MGTKLISAQFKHYDDCLMSGCPGHTMELNIQTVSNGVKLSIDGELWFYADPEMIKMLIQLARDVDYNLMPESK